MVKQIYLEKFCNSTSLEMGLAVIKLAKKRKLSIAIEIARLNHTVFLFIADQLPADKHHWLRRKANVAIQFEESSLYVKHCLKDLNSTLYDTFGRCESKFIAKGGSIPIFVKGSGLIATITVSGLTDEEDHNIIVDALEGKFF